MSWPSAILFDLDGTLADSSADLAGALNDVMGEEGYPALSVPAVTAMIGGGIPLLIERALVAHGEKPPQERVAELFPRYREAYVPRAVESTRLFPGVAEVLEQYHAQGVALGVCTNKPEAISRIILEKLGVLSLFGAVIGGDTLPTKKPDPAPVLEGLSRLGCRPEDGLMVGDSAADAFAAKAAGVRCVLVTFGYSQDPIEDLPSEGVIDHFDAFSALVSGLQAARAPV